MKINILSAFMPSFGNVFIWLNALAMLIGLFLFNWKPEVILVAYFLETIIIGVIHVAKMLMVYYCSNMQQFDVPTAKNTLTGFAAIPFFIFHYFFFIFVQSIFIFTLLKNLIPEANGSFNVFGNYAYLLAQHDIFMAFLTLAFSNVAMTLKNFIFTGTYQKTTISKLFFQPYIRIFIQQFVTILAIFVSFMTNGSFAAALMIIVCRLVVDLYLHTASVNTEFKALLINRLKKNQQLKDAEKTEEAVNMFLEE